MEPKFKIGQVVKKSAESSEPDLYVRQVCGFDIDPEGTLYWFIGGRVAVPEAEIAALTPEEESLYVHDRNR